MNDGRKKKQQKHKNTTAFKITFDTQALEQQKKVSLSNLCIRCTQVLEWKLQYNKYKKMTEVARCNLCQQKNVFRTYMKACQPCSQKLNACAKCLTLDYEQPSQVKVSEQDQKKQQKILHVQQVDFMKMLQQRSRRTVRRWLQKGKITWNNQEEYFVDEEGKKMVGLHFRKGFRDDEEEDGDNDNDVMDQGESGDDDDMFGDDDDQDDEEQSKPKQKEQLQKQAIKPSKQANKADSDIQGDEVQCDNDDQDQQQQQQILQQQLDKMDINDGEVDLQQDEQQQQQQQQQKSKKNNNKNEKNINKTN